MNKQTFLKAVVLMSFMGPALVSAQQSD